MVSLFAAGEKQSLPVVRRGRDRGRYNYYVCLNCRYEIVEGLSAWVVCVIW